MTKGILGRKVGMTQVFDPETGVVNTSHRYRSRARVRFFRFELKKKMVTRLFSWAFEDKKRPIKDRRSRQSQAARSERGHVADIKSKRRATLAAKGVEARSQSGTASLKKFIRELRGDIAGDLLKLVRTSRFRCSRGSQAGRRDWD